MAGRIQPAGFGAGLVGVDNQPDMMPAGAARLDVGHSRGIDDERVLVLRPGLPHPNSCRAPSPAAARRFMMKRAGVCRRIAVIGIIIFCIAIVPFFGLLIYLGIKVLGSGRA